MSPPGTIERRMKLLPLNAETASRRAPPNRPSLGMSMGWTLVRLCTADPFGNVTRLDDELPIDRPGPFLADEGVELVLGQPELVHEAILRGEDVRNLRGVALDLSLADVELEDLDVRECHAGLLLLHPDLTV